MTLDRPEQIVAEKRIDRWTDDYQAWFDGLTEEEKHLISVLVAHLDARPVEDRVD